MSSDRTGRMLLAQTKKENENERNATTIGK